MASEIPILTNLKEKSDILVSLSSKSDLHASHLQWWKSGKRNSRLEIWPLTTVSQKCTVDKFQPSMYPTVDLLAGYIAEDLLAAPRNLVARKKGRKRRYSHAHVLFLWCVRSGIYLFFCCLATTAVTPDSVEITSGACGSVGWRADKAG